MQDQRNPGFSEALQAGARAALLRFVIVTLWSPWCRSPLPARQQVQLVRAAQPGYHGPNAPTMAQRPPPVRERVLSDRHIAAQYEFRMHEQADAKGRRPSRMDARRASMVIGQQLAMATGGSQIIDHELWGTLRAALVSVSDTIITIG